MIQAKITHLDQLDSCIAFFLNILKEDAFLVADSAFGLQYTRMICMHMYET